MRNQLLGGRYRILERIGEGGMAYVYVALDEKLGRRVAIKVLHEHMERNEDIRKRFQLEAQAVSGLDHPNIVKIYDFSGETTERLWIVQEIIDGKNLAQFVEKFRGHELHPVLAACIVREITKAMDAAHSQGIIHRDIKPENIMITGQGLVKLMDFGIAKDLGKSSMTLTGTFMGSPSYMSPEQVRGRDVDHRSDLYSLSVLFYEIVTGRLPFTGQTTHDVVLKIMDGKFTYPRFIIPSIPEQLDQMIVKGMSMDPKKRQQSAPEYGVAIDRFLLATGFDESHVELERYFKNPRDYQKRLAAYPIAKANEPTLKTPPLRSQVATTQDRDTRYPSKTGYRPAPRRAKTTADNERTQKLTRHEAPPAPPAIRAKTGIRPKQPTPRPKPPARTQYPTPAKTQYQRPASPRETVAGHPRRALQDPPRPRRVRAQRVSARPAHPTQMPQGGVITNVAGALLVGMIAAISIWGFWELAGRLNPEAPSTVVEQTTPPPQVKETPTPTKKPVVRKVVERPERTEHTEPVTVKQPQRKPRKKGRIVRRVIKTSRTQPQLVIDQADIEAPKPKPQPVRIATRPAAPQTPTPQPEPEPSPKPTRVAVAKGPAQITVRSQPAAEIYIDGRRRGTTVDSHTMGSGWLDVTPGRHLLELRRSGYSTYRNRFAVAPGEKKSFPVINLVQESAAGGSQYTLTLRVSPLPASVSIRDMQRNKTQAFALNSQVKTVKLDSGRYQVRVTHGEESRERHVVLSGGQRNLTFAVDFKPGE